MYKRKIKYTTVSISEPLMKEITDHIEKSKEYISAGDFVRTAIRDKITEEKKAPTLWVKPEDGEDWQVATVKAMKEIDKTGKKRTLKVRFPEPKNFEEHKQHQKQAINNAKKLEKDVLLETILDKITELEEKIDKLLEK